MRKMEGKKRGREQLNRMGVGRRKRDLGKGDNQIKQKWSSKPGSPTRLRAYWGNLITP